MPFARSYLRSEVIAAISSTGIINLTTLLRDIIDRPAKRQRDIIGRIAVGEQGLRASDFAIIPCSTERPAKRRRVENSVEKTVAGEDDCHQAKQAGHRHAAFRCGLLQSHERLGLNAEMKPLARRLPITQADMKSRRLLLH